MDADHEATLEVLRRRVDAAEIKHRRCSRRLATLRLLRRAIPSELTRDARDAAAALNAARQALSNALNALGQMDVQRSQSEQDSV
jgi:hypothetical protein